MNKEQFLIILTNYLEGRATTQEEQFLYSYYSLFMADEDVMELINQETALKLKRQIKEGIDQRITLVLPRSRSRFAFSAAIAAAVAVVLLSVGLWFYTHEIASSRKASRNDGVVMNDIAPGVQGATLTLANGKKINLSDAVNGELAKEAGVTVTKTAKGQLVYEIASHARNDGTKAIYNTLSTANGETYQVRLPDGSMVWLNAASSLKYPASFGTLAKRSVELQGEGYFEIAKDKAHPFIVKTTKEEVEVLGTHFNINSYADEPATTTTLLEGSVRVSYDTRHPEVNVKGRAGIPDQVRDDVMLKPGQQASLNANNIKISEVNIENVIAWKEGLFVFNDEPLEGIMRKLARWYNVKVVYQNVDKTLLFGGGVSRFDDLNKVIAKLELTGLAHFKIEGRTIIVSK